MRPPISSLRPAHSHRLTWKLGDGNIPLSVLQITCKSIELVVNFYLSMILGHAYPVEAHIEADLLLQWC